MIDDFKYTKFNAVLQAAIDVAKAARLNISTDSLALRILMAAIGGERDPARLTVIACSPTTTRQRKPQ